MHLVKPLKVEVCHRDGWFPFVFQLNTQHTRLGDLEESWFILFSNSTLNTHGVIALPLSFRLFAVCACVSHGVCVCVVACMR